MARAVPDRATGGAGFTQQDVGVWALLHQPSSTHKHRAKHTQSRLSHKDDVLGGGLALCMLQAGNCFPKERKNKDYKRERSISVYFVCSVCLNNCSWHKSKKHSQVFASRRRVSPRMDCSQIFCTPIQSWISVCEGSKGGGRVASLRSRQHYTQVPEGVAPT